MNAVEQFADEIDERWGGRTLTDFRMEAAMEANGTVYESIRAAGARRAVLIVCVTSPDQVRQLEHILDLESDSPPADWMELTLAMLVVRTMRGAGLSFEDTRNALGVRTAITLCATTSDSVALLEAIFEFPT